eukprot:CAMPEP_0184683042 /NCGR_PEP_ID=MMETSP0312-20130426/9723_1 /TAXON_ID=31354 /ORGANISM="Compsopogon coeruleus, Strain SAG 36.94" /LENGTH=219 /DNA_ID=CAMNT_0027135087 /DNA_START=56 /DNA_END=715 /DNA_ORIENTATION=-
MAFVSCGVGRRFLGEDVMDGRCCSRRVGDSRGVVMMVKPHAKARAEKQATVERVRELLGKSSLVANVDLAGLKVSQVEKLKKSVPEDTTIMCVKNTLIRRAVDGDENWESMSKLATYSNLWFFMGEDVKGTVESFNAFLKEIKREATFKGGVMDGQTYDEAGVIAVSQLPTKQELYQKIAIAIKAVPAKVGVSIKAVPTKVARAISLATKNDEQTPEES